MIKRVWQSLRALAHISALARVVPPVPRQQELSDFLAKYGARARGLSEARSLDLGCGSTPRNPFEAKNVYGIDIRDEGTENVEQADLAVDPIPFGDGYFDYVTAFDFIEHIPRVLYLPERRFPFVELMNEIWRSLKPGGMFLSFTPAFPYGPAFQDPTHVNIITHDTFPFYFDNEKRWASTYGFRGSFTVVLQAARPPHLISLLRREH